jgi:hypothetical protein
MASTLQEVINEAGSDGRKAFWAGHLNHWPNYVLGLIAVVAGAIAAQQSTGDDSALVVGSSIVAGASGLLAGWWKNGHLPSKVFGTIAGVAGLIAGASGVPSEDTTSVGAAGFVAGVAGSIGGWWTGSGSEERARYHWRKWSDYKTLRLNAKLAQETSATPERVQQLITELGEIRGRPFPG